MHKLKEYLNIYTATIFLVGLIIFLLISVLNYYSDRNPNSLVFSYDWSEALWLFLLLGSVMFLIGGRLGHWYGYRSWFYVIYIGVLIQLLSIDNLSFVLKNIGIKSIVNIHNSELIYAVLPATSLIILFLRDIPLPVKYAARGTLIFWPFFLLEGLIYFDYLDGISIVFGLFAAFFGALVGLIWGYKVSNTQAINGGTQRS